MAEGKRLRIPPEIRQRAAEFRHPLTAAEECLWQALRGRQLAGLKFRRQEPLGPYIADFYCAEVRVVVEVDGPSHIGNAEYDAIRTAWLEGLGCTVLRFTNEQVFQRLREVTDEIAQVCEEKKRMGNGEGLFHSYLFYAKCILHLQEKCLMTDDIELIQRAGRFEQAALAVSKPEDARPTGWHANLFEWI